ncbi:putative ATP-grasp superfamily ATP-dependent carboligase [Kitasatospora gansuensis]|uniref:Putative ATP-grasp superfamily ATP-dependent carboligase n=1 Tax=Kitasatospora gansuensis TaxID=258050 RepID=A0A7W7WFA4_9ACTN|nr:ATP-grasp domain-containing protein [Kitasatospora gansuensis]MBB4945567.1 putative ATP-grasp superfamily ATP-dependent carboligase [Kitasatospora gansuensis]
MPQARIEPDRATPALLVKIGHYPQHHGGVGVIRTLGRLGVPVYAMVEDRWTPAALSRYLTGAFVRRTDGSEAPADLLAGLLEIGAAIGRPSVPVATDDEAALLLAEHAEALSRYFLLPPVPSGLPRRLASKAGLFEICRRYGVPSPAAWVPQGYPELLAVGREHGYPLVLKNLEAWTRLRAPAVRHTTVVHDEAELRAACPPGPVPSVLVQEYLPPEQAEDWITHLYCGLDGAGPVVFTGRKLRSWPPGAGVTTRAQSLPNRELAALAAEFCGRIGYHGVADLDWRLDRRDGRYKLVDFNPRTGAQFRLFQSADGVDVVRALHLGLTGRPIPAGPQLVRSFGVGQLDLPSAVVTSWRERRLPQDVLPRAGTERGWLCRDDPLPALGETVRFTGTVAERLRRAVS